MKHQQVEKSWVEWEITLATQLTEKNHSPAFFNALIGVIGLTNVLRFVDKEYLQQYGVDLSLTEDLDASVEIIEDE